MTISARASFEVKPYKDGRPGFYVLLTEGYAPQTHINGFATETEADVWVQRDSNAWLAKRYAARGRRAEEMEAT